MGCHINAAPFVCFSPCDPSTPAAAPDFDLPLFKINILPFQGLNFTDAHTGPKGTKNMRIVISIHKQCGLFKEVVSLFFS
jgi:hypothetical protein